MQLDFDVFLPAENDSNILELVFFCILLSHHNARFLFLHSLIFVPSFPLGRVAGQQSLEDSKYLTINSNLGIVLLALRQGGTKQGRRCSHSTWSLDDLLAAFSWV